MQCEVEGCTLPVKYKNMCGLHYKRWWRHGDPLHAETRRYDAQSVCATEDCNGRPRSKGLCNGCRVRLYRKGHTGRDRARNGEGRPQTSAGYILLNIGGRRVYEHIHVAECALGKPLPPGAIVHHVNGIPWDNRPENLVVCPDQAYHLLLHRRQKELGL